MIKRAIVAISLLFALVATLTGCTPAEIYYWTHQAKYQCVWVYGPPYIYWTPPFIDGQAWVPHQVFPRTLIKGDRSICGDNIG